MKTTAFRIGDGELRSWLDGLLAQDKSVVAPVERDGWMRFQEIASAAEVCLAPGKTRWSPKEFLFPRTESLYSYRLQADGPELSDPPLPEKELILLAVRSCDAAGLVRLDHVFLEGDLEDPLYARRRELTTVVAFACSEAEPECFCSAVGGSPMGTEGVDLLVLPFGEYWLVRSETDKGRALVSDSWTPASPGDWSLAVEQVQRLAREIERSPVPANLAETLESRFNSPVWDDVARRCVGCSICAYVCPSCSCFDVQHEGDAWGGREFRCWDACTYALFTKHAAGHNPRGDNAARYRQRTLHKFAYLAPDDEEVTRCVGCGRCISLCPVGIDIHAAVQRIATSPGPDDAND